LRDKDLKNIEIGYLSNYTTSQDKKIHVDKKLIAFSSNEFLSIIVKNGNA